MNKFSLAIHGGAGVISKDTPPEKVEAYNMGLREALEAGVKILSSGGKAIDAVVAAVLSMEENPLFNAGKGAVYNSQGTHELDSSLMDGTNLKCGAVAASATTRNPILLAKAILEKSEHILLSSNGADNFALEVGLEQVNNHFFDTEHRYNAWLKAKSNDEVLLDHTAESKSSLGTVGAVAMDIYGNLAAGTSTGGMTNKNHGRIGDTPLIGAGTYANTATCAVSCTGHGELFIRNCTAYDLHARMLYLGLNIETAADMVIKELPEEAGGFIAVDSSGNIVMPFNSLGMFRGRADSSGMLETAIWE
ncbi:MAG: isoaspartyl peptidase/L-asparaginase [Candidatus Cloacimonetes bacterium]|nr:isoaspartyl peptidase/L-asparaginase [Candidatus Cloacimonadota bacterium]